MRRTILIILIIAFLAAFCAVEQILANNYLTGVKERVDSIYTDFLALNDENISNTRLISKTNELDEYWTQKESILCNFINHKDMEELGIEINKLQTAIKINDVASYYQSLDLIKFYLEGYNHVIGISVQNIF